MLRIVTRRLIVLKFHQPATGIVPPRRSADTQEARRASHDRLTHLFGDAHFARTVRTALSASGVFSLARSLTKTVAADMIRDLLQRSFDPCSVISPLSTLPALNKQVTSFTSFYGGLPAPEHAEGIPLKHKIS